MILAIAILASFIAFLDGSIVNVALVDIERDLGGGLASQQWIVDAYLLTLGAFILLAGAISDRFGRARTLRVGLILFGAASVLCALAPGSGWLIAARLIQGSAAALLVPGSLALINSAYDDQRRPRAIGAWTAWTSVAFILGPVAGGILVDTVGWRWVFAVNLIPVVVALLLMRGMRDDRGSSTGPLDLLGAALVAAGLGALVFALIEQPRLGWDDPLLWTCLIGGCALLVAFFIRQATTRQPLLPLTLFRSRNFAVGNAVTLFVYAGVGLGIWSVTLFLLEVAGLPATLAGLATLPIAVMSILLSGAFGSLSGRYGPRLFMALGPIVGAAGFVVMSTSDGGQYWTRTLPGLILYGLGLAITVAPLTSAVLGAVPPARSGIASAVNNAVARIAGLIAVAIAGTVIGDRLDAAGFHQLALITAGFLVVGGVIAALGIRNASQHPVTTAQATECSDKAVPGTGRVSQ